MPTYRLRILRLRQARSGVDIHIEWLEADQADIAVVQAKIIASNFLGISAGIATLSNENEYLFWACRHNMPKLADSL